MPNLTISIESSLLRAAQAYVARRGMTLNQLICAHLTELTDLDDRRREDRPQEEKQVARQNTMGGDVARAFRFVEKSNGSSLKSSPPEEVSPLEKKPELSPQQVEEKMAEMFKQMLRSGR